MNLKSLRFLVLALAAAMSLSPLAAVLAQQLIPTPTKTAVSEDGRVRRFRVNVPEETLVDLRLRLAATRWPARETVADQSQGMQLAKLGTGPPMIETYPLEKAADAYAHV